MVQSSSSEANWFAASQYIPQILWNPKVHYHLHHNNNNNNNNNNKIYTQRMLHRTVCQ